MNDRASYKRLWGLFAFVVLASFAVLSGFGFRIASEAPPIPDKVVVAGTGQVLFDGGDCDLARPVIESLRPVATSLAARLEAWLAGK